MKILVLGCTGMLGHKLLHILGQKNTDKVIGVCRGSFAFSKHVVFQNSKFEMIENVDCSNLEAVQKVLEKTNPDVVINAVGVTLRHLNQTDLPDVWRLNSALPKFLAFYAESFKKRFIHISTDCVFDGLKGSYKESDWPSAFDIYGQSKFCGEVSSVGSLTLRTSIVGREIRGRTELIEWFLAQKGQSVQGYEKVIYSGVTTNFLAHELDRVIHHFPTLSGLYHVASEPISKYELLKLVNQLFDLRIDIKPEQTKVADKSLNCDRYSQATGFKVPKWPELIQALAAENKLYEEAL